MIRPNGFTQQRFDTVRSEQRPNQQQPLRRLRSASAGLTREEFGTASRSRSASPLDHFGLMFFGSQSAQQRRLETAGPSAPTSQLIRACSSAPTVRWPGAGEACRGAGGARRNAHLRRFRRRQFGIRILLLMRSHFEARRAT